ncbi:hypothetical protein NDU88_005727 [Pleurodeles waltl]|uniref:Uncharacterized protein n=1 Tax=Pleurodeles waltl TaxID=8319 RepID=A0AAV7NT30_PLEWA|nr:hypothetical protein NDU88_005727 [Pleurodeles waltl]
MSGPARRPHLFNSQGIHPPSWWPAGDPSLTFPTSWLPAAATPDPPPLFSQAPRVRVREYRGAAASSHRVLPLPISQRRYRQMPLSALVP